MLEYIGILKIGLEPMRTKLCVLGAGNMGLAIVDGIIASGVLSPSDIILVRRNIDKLSEYAKKGCIVSDDLLWGATNADVLLLALKPQMMADLFQLIGGVADGKLAISIAAGIKIETIENALKGASVVRVMPNTPLIVGEGVTQICRGSTCGDEDFAFAQSLFCGAGYTLVCKEEEINAFSVLTSSSVAFFAEIEEAMCLWAESNGLSGYDRQTLCDLISKTMMGSAALLYEKKYEPKALVKAVASPKGSTERALDVFEKDGLYDLFSKAMTASLRRNEELANLK